MRFWFSRFHFLFPQKEFRLVTLKGCLEEEADLDSKMLSFVRCATCLEITAYVVGERETIHVNNYDKTYSDFGNIKIQKIVHLKLRKCYTTTLNSL